MAIHFINMVRSKFLCDRPLFKVMPIDKAELTLCGKSPYLWFASPSEWNDPFERWFYDTQFESPQGVTTPYWLRNRIFCTCFSNERIVESQWNTYGYGHSQTVGLHFDRKVLLRELEAYSCETGCEVYIGKVHYQTTKDFQKPLLQHPFLNPPPAPFSTSSNNSAVRLLLLKRNAFIEEDEIRIMIVQPQDEAKDQKKGIQLQYKSKPAELVERIVKNPRLTEYAKFLAKLANNGFTDYKDKNGRTQHRIVDSHLYDASMLPTKVKL